MLTFESTSIFLCFLMYKNNPMIPVFSVPRPSNSFMLSTIREMYVSRTSDRVSSLLWSVNHVINLNTSKLKTVDCAALCFTLQHSRARVQLRLLWTFLPQGAIERILPLLDRVSHLKSVTWHCWTKILTTHLCLKSNQISCLHNSIFYLYFN